MNDREQQYGPWEHQAQRVAELWSIYTGFHLDRKDVAIMMMLFKIARGKNKRDTILDIAGYAALAVNDNGA